MKKKALPLYTYLGYLFTLALAAGVGYYLVLNSDLPDTVRTAYMALIYMPTPLYALLLASLMSKLPLRIGQYGAIKQLTLRGVLGTVGVFFAWVGVFTVSVALLSGFYPELVGSLATSSAEVEKNLASVVGPELAAAGNIPESVAGVYVALLVSTVVAGSTVNLIFALGEEYGWRGYLRKAIKSKIARVFGVGALWGAWHAPLILTGYNYGTENALVGVGVMIVFAVAMSYAIEVLMEQYNNVLYAGALHGMFNAMAGSFALLMGAYNPLVGGPIGLLAAFCFVVVAMLYSVAQRMRRGVVSRG